MDNGLDTVYDEDSFFLRLCLDCHSFNFEGVATKKNLEKIMNRIFLTFS